MRTKIALAVFLYVGYVNGANQTVTPEMKEDADRFVSELKVQVDNQYVNPAQNKIDAIQKKSEANIEQIQKKAQAEIQKIKSDEKAQIQPIISKRDKEIRTYVNNRVKGILPDEKGNKNLPAWYGEYYDYVHQQLRNNGLEK
jgi:hypothetical protein